MKRLFITILLLFSFSIFANEGALANTQKKVTEEMLVGNWG